MNKKKKQNQSGVQITKCKTGSCTIFRYPPGYFQQGDLPTRTEQSNAAANTTKERATNDNGNSSTAQPQPESSGEKKWQLNDSISPKRSGVHGEVWTLYDEEMEQKAKKELEKVQKGGMIV